MRRLIFTLCCLGLAVALIGCSGTNYSGDKRYPLKGEVAFEGQPVDLGSISFIPEEGKGRFSGGVITDGKYALPEEKGATVGKYRVEIHWLKRTGRQLRDAQTGEMYDERREALPEKFHSHTELTVEIPQPKNQLDFRLKSS